MIDVTDMTDEQVNLLLEFNGDITMIGVDPKTYSIVVLEVEKETEKAVKVYGSFNIPNVRNKAIIQASCWIPKSQIKNIFKNDSDTVYVLNSWFAHKLAKELCKK